MGTPPESRRRSGYRSSAQVWLTGCVAVLFFGVMLATLNVWWAVAFVLMLLAWVYEVRRPTSSKS